MRGRAAGRAGRRTGGRACMSMSDACRRQRKYLVHLVYITIINIFVLLLFLILCIIGHVACLHVEPIIAYRTRLYITTMSYVYFR